MVKPGRDKVRPVSPLPPTAFHRRLETSLQWGSDRKILQVSKPRPQRLAPAELRRSQQASRLSALGALLRAWLNTVLRSSSAFFVNGYDRLTQLSPPDLHERRRVPTRIQSLPT